MHDSWQLTSASRDRAGGGAEEGGEESEANPADRVEKASGRGPESAEFHLPSRPPALQAPGSGSIVQA